MSAFHAPLRSTDGAAKCAALQPAVIDAIFSAVHAAVNCAVIPAKWKAIGSAVHATKFTSDDAALWRSLHSAFVSAVASAQWTTDKPTKQPTLLATF